MCPVVRQPRRRRQRQSVKCVSRLGGTLRYLDARTNRPAIAASSGERDLGEKGEEKRREREIEGLEGLRFGRTAEGLRVLKMEEAEVQVLHHPRSR